MKRTVAKEFLLLIACIVLVLLVALFGWLRNTWFEHSVASAEREHAEQTKALDSLSQRAVPMRLDFLDLFEPEFVRGNCDVFLIAPFWTMDPFLTGFPRGSLTHQHVEYRKNVYDVLSSSFSDFKHTEQEFFEKLDSDPAYAQRVYDLLSSSFKDFKRSKEGFLSSMNAKPPFDPNKPYFVVEDNPFAEYGGEQLFPLPPSKMNRRYLMCIVKALDGQEYLTPDRLNRFAEKCGRPLDKVVELKGQLNSYTAQHEAGWRPPADAAEVYNPFAPEREMTTWKEVLEKKGIPKDEMTKHLLSANRDTSTSFSLLTAIRGFLCDTMPYAELREGFEYLKERHVLRCNVDDLLSTLQNKLAPPSPEALDALTELQATVDELRNEQNDARASLWSNAKQWAVVKWAAVVLLVLVYPLRLLVLGTRWAVRTLRA